MWAAMHKDYGIPSADIRARGVRDGIGRYSHHLDAGAVSDVLTRQASARSHYHSSTGSEFGNLAAC